MDIGVIGINHKLADLELREALAKACQERFSFFGTDHQPHRFLLLSTCNRTEVYFHSSSLSEAQNFVLQKLREHVSLEFDQKLYSFFREACFHHLCRVTAGLDSAAVAETEIQGQVKTAYEMAKEQGAVPGILHFAFQKALTVGKSIRTKFPLMKGMPSLEQAIFSTGDRYFKGEWNPQILFIGASHINYKVIRHLQRRGLDQITLCNRSISSANRWKNEYGINILPWEERCKWLEYDWLIFGTRSLKPLLKAKDIPDGANHLIIDLSVPRNVEPEVGQLVSLHNIDQLNRSLRLKKRKLKTLLVEAEEHIEDQCKRLTSSFHSKQNWTQKII